MYIHVLLSVISLIIKYLLKKEPLLFEIYIYKEECLFVCLFVLYTFQHRTTECNETFHKYSTDLEEGRRQLFSQKNLPQELLQAIYGTDQ